MVGLMAAGAYADNAVFEIKAYVTDDSFDNNAYKQYGEISVVTKIKNISGRNQQFTILPYAYGSSWTSSLPAVSPSESAMRSIYKRIILIPGEKYTKVLKVRVSPGIAPGAVTFKLGFDPQGKGSPLAWSDDVTFNVTDAQAARWRAGGNANKSASVVDTGDKTRVRHTVDH